MKNNSFVLKIIVALCGSAAFILLFEFLPVWVTACMSTLISVLTFYELAVNAKLVDSAPMRAIGIIVSAAIPWIVYFSVDIYWLYLLIFASALFAFASLVADNETGRADEIINLIFCESIFQVSISLMAPILRSSYGVSVIIMAFITAWGTDAFAQFGGRALGKTKFMPEISPNKTLEGSLSGVIGNGVIITAYAVFLKMKHPEIPVIAVIICGVLCGFLGEIGDLFFSYIKRTAGIKDFGRFIAGHGGVLDRFDSVMFVLPVWYGFVRNFGV